MQYVCINVTIASTNCRICFPSIQLYNYYNLKQCKISSVGVIISIVLNLFTINAIITRILINQYNLLQYREWFLLNVIITILYSSREEQGAKVQPLGGLLFRSQACAIIFIPNQCNQDGKWKSSINSIYHKFKYISHWM